MAKRVLNTAYDAPLHVGLELEGLAYGLLQQTHDFREGVEAFVEKRPPEFTASLRGAEEQPRRSLGALCTPRRLRSPQRGRTRTRRSSGPSGRGTAARRTRARPPRAAPPL